MRFLKGSALFTAVILLFAACSTVTPTQVIEPQAVITNPILAPGTVWSYTDGFHVDFVGTGMGTDAAVSTNPATLAIRDFEIADKIRVQVLIKGGPDDFPYTQPAQVVFTSSAGQTGYRRLPGRGPRQQRLLRDQLRLAL